MQVRALSCRIVAAVSAALGLALAGCGGGSAPANSKSADPNSGSTSSFSVSVSPSTLSFGNQVLNTASVGQIVKLTNTGTAAVTISNIGVTGDFVQSNNCGPNLAVGATCAISVSFSPMLVGTRSGTVTISDNAAGSPHRVSLTGNCVGSGQLSVSPASVSFGSVTVGSTGTRSLQLSNSGAGSLIISTVSTSGPGFSIKGLSVPATLSAGQKLSFSVLFSPSNAGTAAGSVILMVGGSSSPVTVPLAGTATTAAAPHSVTLSWVESGAGVTGYNVYRGTQSAGPFTRINPDVISVTNYVDGTVASGRTYWYVVTSVANGTLESGYSNAVSAVIPSP